MSLRLGGDGAITGCSSLSEPALTLSGLTVNNDSGNTGATITAAGNAFLVLDSSVGGTAGNQISFIDFKNNGTNQANLAVNEGVTGKPLEINSATSNNVTIVTGGGNVGIGTVSPNNLLDVRGASDPQIKVSATNTGTNSAGLYIENQGQRNWQIWADRSSDQLRIGHNSRASTVVSITDTKVGIGASQPLGKLHVRPVDEVNFVVRDDSTAIVLSAETNSGRDNNRLMAFEGSFFNFTTSGNERVRIDTSGRLLIGTSSTLDTSYGTSGGKLQVVGATLPVILSTYTNDTFGARLDFVKSRSTATNGKTIVANGDQLGNIIWGGTDGTNVIPAATISAIVDGTPGTNDMPARLVFLTTPDGGSAPVERLRITSTGNVGIDTSNPTRNLVVNKSNGNAFISVRSEDTGIAGILLGDQTADNVGQISYSNSANSMQFLTAGTEQMRIDILGRICINRTTSQSGGQLSIDYTNGVTAGLAVKDTQTSGTGVVLHVVNGSGSIIGGISQNQSSTSFNTSSDYRLKENIVDLDGAIDRVKQLLPKRFNFINDADTTVDGFLAHETQTVVPEAVTGTHDQVDDEGNAVMQGIDQSKLVPLLTAALKEAIAEIETLKTKVAALEASA